MSSRADSFSERCINQNIMQCHLLLFLRSKMILLMLQCIYTLRNKFLHLFTFYKTKSKNSPIRTKTLVVKNRSFKSHFYSAKDPDPPPFPHKKPYKMHLLISFSSQPDINVHTQLTLYFEAQNQVIFYGHD